jgi:LysM repeat protein
MIEPKIPRQRDEGRHKLAMNTPNPLIPEGSQLEQKSKARSRVRLAVFFVLTVHVVGLMALLVQGCRPEKQEVADQDLVPPTIPEFEPVPVPSVDTNEALLPPVRDLPGEVPPAEPVFEEPPTATVPPAEGLPGAGYQPSPIEPMAGQTYAIQKGDTYYSIGKQFGVSMQALKDANPGVEPTRLQVGQKINIPPAAPPTTAATVLPTASGEIIYTVVSGDTLSKIAAKHGTTWQAIMEINNLSTTKIKVGDKLRIPASNPSPTGASGGR